MTWPFQTRKKITHEAPSEKPLKILIKTNKKGKVEVFDRDTGERITGIGRVNLYVNTFGQVCAEISVKDVYLDLEVDNVRLTKRS